MFSEMTKQTILRQVSRNRQSGEEALLGSRWMEVLGFMGCEYLSHNWPLEDVLLAQAQNAVCLCSLLARSSAAGPKGICPLIDRQWHNALSLPPASSCANTNACMLPLLCASCHSCCFAQGPTFRCNYRAFSRHLSINHPKGQILATTVANRRGQCAWV